MHGLIVMQFASLPQVALAALLRSYVMASFFVPSASMEDSLHRGDIFLGDKFSYQVLCEAPQRGEIAVFDYPLQPDLQYVKRVVGLPGDLVEVRDGKVIVNDIPQELPLKEEPMLDYGPVTVPAESYFVLGDNVNHSSDSRVWGFVPRKNFVAKFGFVIYRRPQD